MGKGSSSDTLFRAAHPFVRFAVSRLSRCVAHWRTLGRPEDSLSSIFGRERRVPHLARLSRQLARDLRSLASPNCLGGQQDVRSRHHEEVYIVVGLRRLLPRAGALRGRVFRVRRDCPRLRRIHAISMAIRSPQVSLRTLIQASR